MPMSASIHQLFDRPPPHRWHPLDSVPPIDPDRIRRAIPDEEPMVFEPTPVVGFFARHGEALTFAFAVFAVVFAAAAFLIGYSG
jgi:hypothetical protein